MSYSIKVGHVNQYGKSDRMENGKVIIYAGRPSTLSNPFFLESENDRDRVINCFKEERLPLLRNELVGLDSQLDRIKAKELVLVCYCTPKRCHCNEIAIELRKIQTLRIKNANKS